MANSGQSRLIRAVLWVFVLLLIVFAVLLVRNLTHEKVEVRVARASFETLSSTVSTNGKVEPVNEYPANAPFAGVLQKIYVHLGDHVQRGAMLLLLNDADAKARIATAEAALAGAKLSLRDITEGGNFDDRNRFQSELSSARMDQSKARTTLETDKALLAKGAVSSGEVAAAQQSLSAADAAVQSALARSNNRFNSADRANAEAHVADAQAAVDAARVAEASVDIKSPIAGTVYSIPFSPFDYVQSGQDMLDVADLTRLQVRAYFDEPDIGKLANGQSVRIVWDAKPGESWTGHIVRVPTTIMTSGTRNVGECLITVDDAKGDLIPNVDVTVTVTEMQRPNVLSVPREALHTDGAKDFVYRIVGGKLAVTPVSVGVVNTTSVEIVTGLKAKDIVGPPPHRRRHRTEQRPRSQANRMTMNPHAVQAQPATRVGRLKLSRFLAFAGVASLSVSTLHAQVSLTTAVDLALRQSPKVKLAQDDVAKAIATLQSTHDIYIPSLSAGANLGQAYGYSPYPPTLFSGESQSLIYNSTQFSYIKSARAGLAAANLSLKDARDAVSEDVAVTYAALLKDAGRDAALRQQQGFARSLVEIVQERFDAGRDTAIDLTQSKLTLANINLSLLHAEDDTLNDQAHLAALTGLPGASLRAEDSFPPITLPENFTPAGDTVSPGVQAAFLSATAKQLQAQGDNKFLYRPDVRLIVQYNRYATFTAAFKNLETQYKNIGSSEEVFGVQINIPLFDKFHQAKGRESIADAAHSLHDAENIRMQAPRRPDPPQPLHPRAARPRRGRRARSAALPAAARSPYHRAQPPAAARPPHPESQRRAELPHRRTR